MKYTGPDLSGPTMKNMQYSRMQLAKILSTTNYLLGELVENKLIPYSVTSSNRVYFTEAQKEFIVQWYIRENPHKEKIILLNKDMYLNKKKNDSIVDSVLNKRNEILNKYKK